MVINQAIRERAGKLSKDTIKLNPADRRKLEAIANGTRKQGISQGWWNQVNQVASQSLLDRIAAMSDPERNNQSHERSNARAALARVKARQAVGITPDPAPLPATLADWDKQRRKPRTPAKPDVS